MHHGVRIKDAALVAAAVLSNRYITDRFLPDKAIDLVDEAAARLRTEIDSMPAELDEIRRRIMQLEIEREALQQGEGRGVASERLAKLEKELADLQGRVRRAARRGGRPRRTPCSACAQLREQVEQTKVGDRAGRAAVRPQPRRRAEVRQAGRARDASCRRRANASPSSRAGAV